MSDKRENILLKLRERAGDMWKDSQRTRFDWRMPNATLIDTRTGATISTAQQVANDASEIRSLLRASDAIAMLSIRVTAKDMTRKGKLVETWLRCALIRRMVERAKPNREGIGHNRYTILIAYLVAAGLAESDGCNGYQWTNEFKSLARRAEWLAQLARREGELRHPQASHRYSVTLDD